MSRSRHRYRFVLTGPAAFGFVLGVVAAFCVATVGLGIWAWLTD